MAQHYLVVSDLHLCDVEEHADGWKAYKSARHVFDDELDDVVARFLARGEPTDDHTLVLNGDILDFDLVCAVPDDPPWPVSPGERRHGLDPTPGKSVFKLERILADHPGFLSTVARVLAGGHRVVYLLGNHDRELCFAEVREAFVAAVRRAAEAEGLEADTSALVFEPWFFHVPGELFVEHGQQYDYYTSFRYVLDPVVREGDHEALALPMGNLSNRRLMTHMGFFNPHASDYILNVFRYFTHWLKHYAFSRRSLVFRWIFGSVGVMWKLLQTKRRLRRAAPDHDELLRAHAARTGLPEATLRALDELKRLPITTRWYRVFREFWLDRILAAALFTGATIALALSPIPLWIKLMVPISSFPLAFFIYESLVHGETVFSAADAASGYAQEIAELVDARVVTFGHTHHPHLVPLKPGVTYVNTGTWAPVWADNDPDALLPGLRNALTVTFDGDEPRIQLSSEGSRRPDRTDGRRARGGRRAHEEDPASAARPESVTSRRRGAR